jgi:hypothetical protein
MTSPVGMTRGKGGSSGRVVAEREPFFIALGGPKAHDFSGQDDKKERRRFQRE